ncbi:MAG: preprotein translocase subunit SecE [Ruminococcus sp.]|nr:preprotein translocase subunit SecE [Ruminococcus sp.]
MAKEKENTTPEKKSKKSEKKKPNRVVKWFKDLKSEFKKVVWPTRKTVVNNTAVVVVVVAIAAILVGALDAGFLKIMDLIYNH